MSFVVQMVMDGKFPKKPDSRLYGEISQLHQVLFLTLHTAVARRQVVKSSRAKANVIALAEITMCHA